MSFLLGLFAATAGLCCIAATQSKHATVFLPNPLPPPLQRAARWTGTGLLLASAVLGVAAYGFGVGLVSLCAWACLGAWLIALTLTWRRSSQPRR